MGSPGSAGSRRGLPPRDHRGAVSGRLQLFRSGAKAGEGEAREKEQKSASFAVTKADSWQHARLWKRGRGRKHSTESTSQRITRPRHLPGQGHRHVGHRQGRERGRKEISEFSSRVLWPLHLKSVIATGWCFADSTWLIVFRKATVPAGYRHHVHSKPSTPGNPVNFPCYTPVKEAAPGHSSARPPPRASLLENGGPKPSPSPGTGGFMLQDSMPHLCPSPAKEAGQFCYKQKIETT